MPIQGPYSKGVNGGYDEDERLAIGLVREKIAWVDADENRKEYIRLTWIRRALETVIGNASPNDGYKIVGDGSSNDFIVKGGDGTNNGAGRIWVNGLHCFLLSDVRYVNTGSSLDEDSMLPSIAYITGGSNNVLQDAAASYVPGSLVGRTITPDVTQPAVTAAVLANTANTITVSIDLTAAGIATGARYRLETSTPSGSDRNDGVYLNVHLREVTAAEVPSIVHALGTSYTGQHFAQVRAIVEVHEGDTAGLPGDLDTYYVDADGFEHWRVKLADIQRYDGVATIAAVDVSDLRTTSANFSTFLRKTGDNMSGDLTMLAGANIVLAAGGLVDGRDVSVDGAKLDLIDFTDQGIADLLPKISYPTQASFPLSAVAATQTVVGQSFRDEEPGGNTTTKGVGTVDPNNLVLLRDATTRDELVVGNNYDRVFGELTEAHPFPSLTGTWTFTNASQTLVGVGGVANTQLVPQDLILGPDGVWYTVDSITNDNAVQIVEPFAGATANLVNPSARRWLLDLYYYNAGVKTAYVPPAPVDLDYYYHKFYDMADRPVVDPMLGVATNRTAPAVRYATETAAGVVTLSADLGTTAGEVVQANDTRVGRVKAAINGGAALDYASIIDVTVGTGLTAAIAKVGERVTLTLTNSAPGGSSFPGYSANPGDVQPDAAAAATGANALAARIDHVHGLSPLYATKIAMDTVNPLAASFSAAPGFTPRLAIVLIRSSAEGFGLGFAYDATPANQAYLRYSGNAGNTSNLATGAVYEEFADQYQITTFSSANVTVTRTAGGGSYPGVILVVIGDNLP